MLEFVKKVRMHGVSRLSRFAQIELQAKLFRLLAGSYSQGQEDLVINRLLGNKPTGLYVEVGAADGKTYSNTYYFYNKGWQGINIEPDPDNFAKLTHHRNRDINVNLGISSKPTTLTLYRFSPGVLSTFSSTVAQEFKGIGYTYLGQTAVACDTLANIFDRCLNGKQIDFMGIDTEGFDLEVLKSNNWAKYLPRLICIEVEHAHHAEGKTHDDEMHIFLTKKNYQRVFDNGINLIYQLTQTSTTPA